MKSRASPRLTAEEAAARIADHQTVAFGGFASVGAPKLVPRAIAARALAEHAAGRSFKVNVVSGSPAGPSLDGTLARAHAIEFLAPWSADPDLRQNVSSGETRVCDMHCSRLPQDLRYGFLGPVHFAVIEACDLSPYGEIVLTSSVGAALTFCRLAGQVIIELNRAQPSWWRGAHDLYEPKDPPRRTDIPILHPSDRIGRPVILVDPAKIVGVVETNVPEDPRPVPAPDATALRIGNHVADFLAGELRRGLIPPRFLPIQCGIEPVDNAILAALAAHPDIPPFTLWSETISEAALDQVLAERVLFASSCSLTAGPAALARLGAAWDFFRPRLILRPQEITNNPELIRRLGVISINSALEADLSGNINCTRPWGSRGRVGIGGSADFARNAFLSIFVCPSIREGGRISSLVPLVRQVDSSEHSVSVIVTEQGVADLRMKSPRERAETLIRNCVHPNYQGLLRSYLSIAGPSHTPRNLDAAFNMHLKFALDGDMRGAHWNGNGAREPASGDNGSSSPVPQPKEAPRSANSSPTCVTAPTCTSLRSPLKPVP
jgi:acetyl-CoA hydrolase